MSWPRFAWPRSLTGRWTSSVLGLLGVYHFPKRPNTVLVAFLAPLDCLTQVQHPLAHIVRVADTLSNLEMLLETRLMPGLTTAVAASGSVTAGTDAWGYFVRHSSTPSFPIPHEPWRSG